MIMTRKSHRILLAGLFLLLFLLPASQVLAVRPFVTDDARIIDYGQVEVENWLEFATASGSRDYVYNVMGGVSPTEWLEIIAGAGVGYATGDDEGVSLLNPVLQPKVLLFKTREDGTPGLALAAGVLFPHGSGPLSDDGWGGYLLALTSTRQFDDWLSAGRENTGRVLR